MATRQPPGKPGSNPTPSTKSGPQGPNPSKPFPDPKPVTGKPAQKPGQK